MNFIINALFDSNKYFNDQAPWKKKDDLKRLNTIVYTALELIRKICIMLFPVIPNTVITAFKIFNLSESDIVFSSIENHNYLISGNKIDKIDILFKKIEKKND